MAAAWRRHLDQVEPHSGRTALFDIRTGTDSCRKFKDAYRFGLGANYRWTDNFMLKFGVSYDKAPVPDALHRFAFLPDNNRTALSFGAKHQLSKAGTLDVGYTHLFLSDGGAQRNGGVAVAAGQQGTVSGSYKVKVNMVSLQYTHAF